MKPMLVFSPFFDIHGGHEKGFRSLLRENVHHARVAEIIADTNPQSAPGRFPDLLVSGRKAILEKLDGLGLGLLKYHVPLGTHDVSRVKEVSICGRFDA